MFNEKNLKIIELIEKSEQDIKVGRCIKAEISMSAEDINNLLMK